MSDSDSDTPITRVNSEPKSYDVVPGDIPFILKFVNGTKVNKHEYILKEGYPLPHRAKIGGNQCIHISKCLKFKSLI